MELNRKTRRWFNVGKIVPEKLRVARCCTFLTQKLCHACPKSQKAVLGYKTMNPEDPDCLACLDETYRQVYHEERK